MSKCKHTEQPTAYLAWHQWAQKMRRTHRQTRCPGCGLFYLWKPKRKRAGVTP